MCPAHRFRPTLNVVLYYATEFIIHNILYYVNFVFYSIVTSGILDILGVTIEKNARFRGYKFDLSGLLIEKVE